MRPWPLVNVNEHPRVMFIFFNIHVYQRLLICMSIAIYNFQRILFCNFKGQKDKLNLKNNLFTQYYCANCYKTTDIPQLISL